MQVNSEYCVKGWGSEYVLFTTSHSRATSYTEDRLLDGGDRSISRLLRGDCTHYPLTRNGRKSDHGDFQFL